MKKQLSSHAQAAKEIRAFIKSKGLKASVKSDSFSMGNAVRISFTDQDPSAVDAIYSELESWQYGSFNAMEDIYEMDNHHSDRTQVKYVTIQQNYSDTLRDKAWFWYLALNPNRDLPSDWRELKGWEAYSFFEIGESIGNSYRGDSILYAIIESKSFRSGYKPRMRAA